MTEISNNNYIQKRRGRPIKSLDGKPNSKPLDPNYFNNYYYKNLAVKVMCENCGELVSKCKLKAHIKTSKCTNAINDCNVQCPICSKYISPIRKLQHEKSKYCLSKQII